jgi:hypothetical protein
MATLLKDALDRYINGDLGVPRVLEEYKVYCLWEKIDDPKLKMNASFEKFSGGVLYLSVNNSTWAQQVNLLKHRIMSLINGGSKNKLVNDIKIKSGNIEKARQEPEGKKEKQCPYCNATHYGDEIVCAVCERERADKTRYKILRLAVNNPGMSFNEAKSAMPEIDQDDFRKALSVLNAMAVEKKILERRSRGKKSS